MKVHMPFGNYEEIELDEPVTVEQLEARLANGEALFFVAQGEPDENGCREIALVMRERSLVLIKDQVDALILALADARVEVWGPDLEM